MVFECLRGNLFGLFHHPDRLNHGELNGENTILIGRATVYGSYKR